MRYRPSKSFKWWMAVTVPLLLGSAFWVLPRISKWENAPIPGEIVFASAKPAPYVPALPTVPPSKFMLEWSRLRKQMRGLVRRSVPKEQRPDSFGVHFFSLKNSKDRLDRAKYLDLKRLASVWRQRLGLRYPELAVTMKSVPDDRNGFLKWLEFSERLPKIADGSPDEVFSFPPEITAYLRSESGWDPVSARTWLAGQKPLLEEIRAIGLKPESSVNRIDVERWGYFPALHIKRCADALMIEARLRAEDGDAAGALESIQAAKGLGDHLINIETPTLLGATVQILIQRGLEKWALSEIIPALPPGKFDPVAWESVLDPSVHTSVEFARLLRGEWNATVEHQILPVLLDADDPKSLPDPGALLDAYATIFVENIRSHEAAKTLDLPSIPVISQGDTGGLSKKSREISNIFDAGFQSWRTGWMQQQFASGMTQAAFAILKGHPVPVDPVYGLPYLWDPATRILSFPNDPRFDDLNLEPIKVPRL